MGFLVQVTDHSHGEYRHLMYETVEVIDEGAHFRTCFTYHDKNEGETYYINKKDCKVVATDKLNEKHDVLEGASLNEVLNEMKDEIEIIPISKYHREIAPDVWVDVYDVLDAFGVTNPGNQHAIKKQLMPGNRGVKDKIQDLKEARASLDRAIELEERKL